MYTLWILMLSGATATETAFAMRTQRSTSTFSSHGSTDQLMSCVHTSKKITHFAPVSFLLMVLGVTYTIFTVVAYQNITETTLLFVLSGLGCILFGLLADQVASIRRGG